MVKLTSEIKADFGKIKIFPFATSSKAGVPNVAPMGMMSIRDDDETVWIIDNFMQKTLQNVKENPNASFYIWSPETSGAWQIKGTITVETSGADYEAAKESAKGRPAKTLLKMKVTSVYSVKPGPTAGAKIL
ncbi:MAG: pyridoxamine 5'-phosphate oxidase family protein [Methanomassiliicoccaceae archaeon]|jgi:predicted pyridoxine 5'-phosphate oxidase superfamily flavin-nucleotide-binding protein|nr:pyridoxamine 5'-phosphate oxidase family protein [Methanomassiliicoccaceae archaeon]